MSIRRAAALATLLVLAGCTEAGEDARDPVVARVNGEPIRAAELRAALAQVGLGAVPAELANTVLEEIVDQRLLLRAAREKGLRVADEEVDRAVTRLQADYPGETFGEMLAAEGIEPASLRTRARKALLVQRLFVEEVVARVAVTDDEIAAWIEAHGAELAKPERVRAAQIVVKSEEEARRLHAELQKGASFEELAAAHSLSPDGKNGGDLGFFARGEMPPPFDEVCFSLQPGKLSDVVSSSYGFHVFKVLERHEAVTPEPETLRREAERRLRREKEAAAQTAFLRRLREAAQIDVDEAALLRQLGNP
ncbi:peptidylprolyl isomerase [Vulgatibacter sp.]|uniref:peptidylprolyl isomerase n=1 Tax=Vulgatibacter sp. TaxID=1971226 RepID=UPI0035674EBA